MPPSTITLTAEAHTHIWRKPPAFDFDNAPRHMLPPQPLSSFSRARVTASADWRGRRDNIGLLLRFTSASHPAKPSRYVRVGPEIFKENSHEEIHISVVSSNTFSDWSLHQKDADDEAGRDTTVEVRVERDLIGCSFFVYYLSMDSYGGVKTRHALRELAWMFEEEDLQVEVGVYAASPSENPLSHKKNLVAMFRKLVIE